MIFERAVRREFAQGAAGVFVALFAIMISTQLIRLLGDAAGGRVAPEAVLALLGFSALNYMPVLLSLTVFISVLLTLSRSYRDSEMVVWFASGLPLTAWIRPVLIFALPIIIAVGALSLFLSPWALSQSSEYRQKLDARSDTSQVTPGTFKEASQGQRIVFVEAMSEDVSQVRNVFVNTTQEGVMGVVMAATGHQEVADNGDRFMVLDKGRRYEVEPGSLEYKIMDFERYWVRISDGQVKAPDRTPKTMQLLELLRDSSQDARAELVWRLGLPLSAFILALLAIPLSFVNPRAGRSANLILAILVYTIYNNLISISQASVAQGRIGFEVGAWLVHAGMLALLPLMFYRRIAVNSFWRWWFK